MLRLFLDPNNGASLIPCPTCGRPMVLAAQRGGVWVVAYERGFRKRPDTTAMLVCPDYDCDYREEVAIARTPDDAVIFTPSGGSHMWQLSQRSYERTLDELRREIEHLTEQYRRTGNPKLPSAVKFWKERYSFQHWNVRDGLERAFREGGEVYCETTGDRLRGQVRAVLPDSVILEREEGTTILVPAGDLKSALPVGKWSFHERPDRFDFGKGMKLSIGNHVMHTPTRYVVIGGHSLEFDSISYYGILSVHTANAEAARDLGLWSPGNGKYYGEFPSHQVERCYKLIRYCNVKGHRLHLHAFTKDPDVVQLRTRDIEIAQALGMPREHIIWCGQRQTLRWSAFFHANDITAREEIPIRIRLPKVPKR